MPSNVLLTSRFAALSGCILCLLAVAVGAFGAHALSDLLIQNQRMDTFELANRYHFYHGLGLLCIAALTRNTDHFANKLLNLAIGSLFIGTIIFSLSLYALAISNASYLGAITPIGGSLLILGWLSLLLAVIKS